MASICYLSLANCQFHPYSVVISLNEFHFVIHVCDHQFVHKPGCHRVGGALLSVSYSPGIDYDACTYNMSYQIGEHHFNTCPPSHVFPCMR